MTQRPALRRLAAAAGLLLSAGAIAQTSPWYVGGAIGVTHESNLFRSGGNVAAVPDTLVTTSLLGGIDQPIGRQRVRATASLRDNRFSDRSELNNFGYGVNAALDWATVARLSGTLSVSANQSLASFNPGDELALTKKNVQRNNAASLSAVLGTGTRLQFEASLGWTDITYSAVEFDSRELSQNTASLGARYALSGTLSAGLSLSHAEGEYPLATTTRADEFERDALNLNINWQASGASTITARLSATRQRHSQVTNRDFDGLTGLLRWTWRPTGRTSGTLSLTRDNGQDNLNYVIFGPITGETDISRVTTSLVATAAYELTGKIGLRASVNYSDRSISDIRLVNNNVFTQVDYRDRGTGASIGMTWVPLRFLSVNCDLGEQRRRNPTLPSQNYSNRSLGCSAQATLR
ncbi:MAG: hypothetical protein ACKVQR_00665 [Aquabacterium sp.]